MASVILKTVGASIGNALIPGLGGYVLGGLGQNLGNIIDAKLGLGTTVTGPRLENLSVQDSRYGAGIPLVYGNARIAGNVIWSSDLIETKHTSTVGGKGGSGVTTKTYTYSVHCAVSICEGPIASINTIWADNTVIYQDGVWKSDLFDGVSVYLGTSTQTSNSFMQSILGSSNVPTYRGLAYIVFENLQLDDFGSRLPNLTFEIASDAATANPEGTGVTSATVIQRSQTAQNATMGPLVLEKSGADVQKVLIGGLVMSGSTAAFNASEYHVSGDAPTLLNSVTSATFASSTTPAHASWAMAPDGRFVACHMQSSLTVSHTFMIYDTESQTFGNALSLTLSNASVYKQIAWVDATHFVVDHISGGIRGLEVFARAGTNVIDLGFTPLWGSNSGTTTMPFYGAQFTPYADGLLAYNFITSSKTLQARTLVWRNNALSLGAIYCVASGLTLGSGSGMHAKFIKTASGEWTLLFGTVSYFSLMSFEPSSSAATITRPWQTLTQSYGSGTTHYPVLFNNRLLIVQNSLDGGNYLISEITLGDASFTLSVDAAAVSNLDNFYSFFHAIKLNGSRLLFAAVGGSSYAMKQIAIIERNAQGTVAAVLEDILTRAGYASGDYDVSALSDTSLRGYVLQEPLSARNAIEPLQTYAPFDLIETCGQLKAVLRGGDAGTTVPSTEWRAAFDDREPPAPLLITRAEEMDLPREVTIDVVDPSRNFEVNCQRARRLASSARSIQKISLPVVCPAKTAKQIAESKLYTAWAERELVRLCVSRTWLGLDPADVINLGNGSCLRLASVRQSGGLIKLEGFYSQAANLNSSAEADTGDGIGSNSADSVASTLYLMDAPLLQASDDQPGVYVAVTGLSGWKGASVLRSSDGISYSTLASTRAAATAGNATTALADGSPYYLDGAHSVNVQLEQETLSSCTLSEMLNGANAAMLGREILQFQTATLVGPGLYTLSNLLRGRRGTEDATASHTLGESFVLLQSGVVDFIPDALSNRGKSFFFRAVSSGQSLSEASDYSFTYGMKTLCPFAPAHVTGVRSAGTSGDVTLTWVRRARLNAEWADYIDVPLDESAEQYEVDIMNGTNVVRAFTGLTTASVTYTSAQQTTDWRSSVPSSFTVNVYQVSARYGNGKAAVATI